MSASKTLIKYYKNRISSAIAILDKPANEVTGEDIHQLRVEIKKIKAFSKLIAFSDDKFEQKSFIRPFRKIFDQAGKVREIELERFMLKKIGIYEQLETYQQHLTDLYNNELELFHSACRDYKHKLRKKSKYIEPLIEETDKKTADRFLEKRRDDISKLIHKKNIEVNQIHDLRKMIKEYYYTSRIFKSENDFFIYLDDFQELLGEWHDREIMIECLQHTVDSGKLNSEDLKRIAFAQEQISVEREEYFDKIMKRLSYLKYNTEFEAPSDVTETMT